MAQPGNFTPILLYGSSTPTNVPLAANLTNSATGSEIAINVADKNLFFKDSGGTVNTVPIRQSSTSSNGWLSSTDWNTFNGKAPATSGTSILYGNGAGGFSNVTIGSGITFAGGTLSATGSGGTVTSVAATVPSFLSISGSPITTSGTLAITLSGTALPVANGGTGLTSLTASYIPYGNGTSALNSSSALQFDGTNLRFGTNLTNGIYFGASSQFNDYETGTWTPTDGSGAGLSFTGVSAIYTKVGRLVTVCFALTFPTTANTAQVTISGLPYTASSGTTNPGAGAFSYTNSASAFIAGAIFTPSAGGTTINLYTSTGGPIGNNQFSAAAFRVTFTYTAST